MMTLPQGASSAYRFRADLNGTQFWSADSNNCTLPGCTSADVTVTLPLTVTVQSQAGDLYPNLKVYAFDGTVYTGFHGTTDANGKVTLTLPQGNYRFRADYDGVQFWSAQSNTCALPGCTTATVTLPGGVTQGETTIDYTYDPLYRLTAADYSTGDFYHYTYDAVGNRMTQQNMINGHSTSIAYAYDDANRLANVNDATYTYDANGNLRSDGVNDYTYDPANRLTSVFGPSSSVTYAYNGLGDRLSQNVNGVNTNYTLDLNAGLTQVLSDGTTSYTYGLGRISQSSNSTAEYFLSDALGSVRQLTDSTGAVTYAAAYDPYGAVTQTSGAGQTVYGFTGEQQSDDLVYLRARYLSVNDGRFLSRDTWEGKVNHPMSMNRWMYVEGNPVNATDPSGFCKNANGSVNWLEWPWGPWWPCNTGQVNNLPATNPPTTTNTPIPPTLTPCSSKIVLTPIPGITFSGEKWSDEEKAAVLEGVKWSMNFLGNKANSGLGLIGRGINFVLKRNKGDDTGAGMESFAWNALINVKLPREDVAIVYPSLVRTQAIHEMGHYVDYYAAKAIGSLSNFITSDDMSRESTYWVGEWEWAGFDQAGRGQWNYTGSADPNTLPSNYLWDKNLQLCARHNCPAEDFAETFTWMVYENERKINTNIWALDRSDIGYNYQKPSGNRTKAVSDIIKLLP
jgi:RHS repeat-associated protein